jgi:hypothetical protein
MKTDNPNTVSDVALDESLNPSTIDLLEAIDRLRAIEDARQEHDIVPPPGAELFSAADDVVISARLLGTPSPEEHPIALAVARLAAELRLHELDTERLSRRIGSVEARHPTLSFLQAMVNVFEAREKIGIPSDGPRKLEPLLDLISQGVSKRQIATMYGLDLNQLEQELEKPGSVTGKPGYVSPHDRQQKQQLAREEIEIDSLGSAAAAITLKRGTQEKERALAKL